MLWSEKHRPLNLNENALHSQLCKRLSRLAESDDVPHLMFYGPPGAGKNTLITSFICSVFGKGSLKVKVQEKKLSLKSNKIVEFRVISSNFHLRLNPSSSGNYDKNIIQETLKEIASTKSLTETKRPFKVIVIDEAENLSETAQHSLRRTMEKYTQTCRLILVCQNVNRLIDPLISRCLCIRVPAPTGRQIDLVLEGICNKEKLTLPEDFKAKIVSESNRNLRRAINSLEMSYLQQYPFTNDQDVTRLGWEEYLWQLALFIAEEQSAKRLLAVRGKVYDLLGRMIPPEIVLKTLCTNLISKCDFSLQKQVIEIATIFEERLRRGNKPIYHIEAFVAKFMSLYRDWKVNYLE